MWHWSVNIPFLITRPHRPTLPSHSIAAGVPPLRGDDAPSVSITANNCNRHKATPCLLIPPPQAFRRYAALVHGRLSPKYGAATHWAKLEVPQDGAELAAARAALAARFPLAEFNAARAEVDPKNVLANSWLDTLVGGSRISA